MITLFDKSFLQSLTVDESVWFDHFFITNICPIFYVETLADLDKQVRKGRTSEQEVEIIAKKSPEVHGSPCIHHFDLCVNDLTGFSVPMTGQIPIRGRTVKVEDKTSGFAEPSPESEAFSRWQKGEFLNIERQFARYWRTALSNLDLNAVARNFGILGIDAKSCKSLEDAKSISKNIVYSNSEPHRIMELAFIFLGFTEELRLRILERWANSNYSPLHEYAPYVAHVLTIELFFHIALAAGLISSAHPSNHIDIAYLFYLPFCMIFVSSDHLHKQCVPLFLREDQAFIWGQDLKKSLTKINRYYSQLPDEIKERGVVSFASDLPKINDPIIEQLRHKFFKQQARTVDKATNKLKTTDILSKIKMIEAAPSLPLDPKNFDAENTESVVIKRHVKRIKGSWYQIPKKS